MSGFRSLCGVVAVILCLGLHVAHGQKAEDEPGIRRAIATKTVRPGEEERAEIEKHCAYWCKRLTDRDTKQIAGARNALLQPFRIPGATPQFAEAYSEPLASRLLQVMNDQREIVRINAMIVAGALRHQHVNPLIKAALADANPAVRYLSGKAGANIDHWIKASPLEAEAKKQLLGEVLNDLANAYDRERDGFVLDQLYLGMVGLRTPEAEQMCLALVERRVNALQANPNRGVSADYQVMDVIYLNYVTKRGVPDKVVRSLAQAAYRYLLVTSRAMSQRRVDRIREPQYVQMARLSANVLIWASTQPDSQAQMPPKLESQIKLGNWPFVLQTTEGPWRDLLAKPPFVFVDKDLDIAGD